MTDSKRRIFLVVALLIAGSALAFIAYGSLGDNMVYYMEPTELVEKGDEAYGKSVRLGGFVKLGTVDWDEDDKDLKFTVSDNKNDVEVHFSGSLPEMFRENIGVVLEGTLSKSNIFEAERIMVKHSNEYKAPEEGIDSKDLYQTLQTDEDS